MTDLTDRLHAALDEAMTEEVDRQLALVLDARGGWPNDYPAAYDVEARERAVTSQAGRVVEAHRKILDLHAPGVTLTRVTDGGTVTLCVSCGGWHTMKNGTEWPCDTIKALAEAYGVEA